MISSCKGEIGLRWQVFWPLLCWHFGLGVSRSGGKLMSTKDIYHYQKVDEKISTAGQPSEQQLKAAADEGFETVINLATIDPRYSLADEAGLVGSLGMEYYHIPVAWEQPQESDFTAFSNLLGQLGGKKVLIHCAANYRVTAFFSLYGAQNLGWSDAKADQFRALIWKPGEHPVWQEFIRQMTEKLKSGG
jgi:protein tyrosine phosphatase (PTP) superfamily phosphohydrolase (DUF442 family)